MIIRKQTLQAAVVASTADDSRYYLDAVQIEPNGDVVATNGHILIKVSDDHPLPDEDYPSIPSAPFTGNVEGPIVVSSSIVARMIAATPKGKRGLPILQAVQVGKNGTEHSAVLSATDLQVPVSLTIEPTEQRFPAYDRILPKADRPVLSVILGVPVLEALLKSAKALGSTTVRFALPTDPQHQGKTNGNPDGVICSAIELSYQSTDGVKALAIAMPCRL